MELNIPEINHLSKKVDILLGLMEEYAIASGQKSVLTIKDIARIEEVSPASLYEGGAYRYLLPQCGESEYEGTARWKVSTFLSWREIPVEVRKGMYQSLLREGKEAYIRAQDDYFNSERRSRRG